MVTINTLTSPSMKPILLTPDTEFFKFWPAKSGSKPEESDMVEFIRRVQSDVVRWAAEVTEIADSTRAMPLNALACYFDLESERLHHNR